MLWGLLKSKAERAAEKEAEVRDRLCRAFVREILRQFPKGMSRTEVFFGVRSRTYEFNALDVTRAIDQMINGGEVTVPSVGKVRLRRI
jgi:hypothetical protein